jgi:hypothetical protein
MTAGRATMNFFERDVMKLPERWQQCIEVQREYLEKLALHAEKEMFG